MLKNKHVLIVENAGSSLSINESTKGAPKLKLDGKFTEFDIQNRNKRMYTAEKFLPCMNAMLEKKKTLGVLYGEYDHPDVFDVTCKNLSHVIDSLVHNEKSNCIDGEITLLNNSWGKEARSIIEDNYPLFVSSRAAGVTDDNGVVHLKELFTYDIVADPGFASAKVTPTLVNEKLGFKVDDTVPYRIYEMSDAHAQALFVDNKNDQKTHMDIAKMEVVMQEALVRMEADLLAKLTSTKKYAPEEVKTLNEQVETLREELAVVNRILEFFKTKINTLVTLNTKLEDENKKMQDEIKENFMHANHLSTHLKSIKKYTMEIDERLTLDETFMEQVAEHSQANIYFSKDISENLSDASSMLEYVAKHVDENKDALLYVINEGEDVKGMLEHVAEETALTQSFLEHVAEETQLTQGLLEHTAKESFNDSVWLGYVHEKVDGAITFTQNLVEALKKDGSKINESTGTETEVGKMDNIDKFLGLEEEEEMAKKAEMEAQAKAQIDPVLAQAQGDVAQVQDPQAQVQVQPVQDPNAQIDPNAQVQPTTEPTVQPVVGAQPAQDAVVATGIQTIEPVAPVQPVAGAQPLPTDGAQLPVDGTLPVDGAQPTGDGSLKSDLLQSLFKVLDTEETGIVVDVTPDGKLVIQKSGDDSTQEYTMDQVEKVEYTDTNVVETVKNLMSEIKKQKALAEKAPHFFNFLSEKQINEFKSLEDDTKAKIITEMKDKEYFSDVDVLNQIAGFLGEKKISREERLLTCLPEDLKAIYEALPENDRKEMINESRYFPLVNEFDMINYWNTRPFAKPIKSAEAQLIKETVESVQKATMIKESTEQFNDKYADDFLSAVAKLK